jgi:hypothetical protein
MTTPPPVYVPTLVGRDDPDALAAGLLALVRHDPPDAATVARLTSLRAAPGSD